MLDHPEQQISGDKAQGSAVAAEADDEVVGAAFGGPDVRSRNNYSSSRTTPIAPMCNTAEN